MTPFPDGPALERLRSIFLGRERVRGPYWRHRADLKAYDATFGERIGWKWDAVLGELTARGWRLPAGPVLDFGCGSGIAGRRVLAAFGVSADTTLWVHDRSRPAVEFACAAASDAFPGVRVGPVPASVLTGTEALGTLVVSHVLNELPARERCRLLTLARRAEVVLWVEPGTHADSRALIAVREALREHFRIISPCPHGGRCGMTSPGNERHWCHFFARPPSAVFSDPQWAAFARCLGVDLRSLPFSHLVLDRRPGVCPEAGWSRLVGAPRRHKGFSRIFACDAGGVRELRLSARGFQETLDRIEAADGLQRVRWQVEGDSVVAVEALEGGGIGRSPESATVVTRV